MKTKNRPRRQQKKRKQEYKKAQRGRKFNPWIYRYFDVTELISRRNRMSPIDADRLKETIKKLDVESPDIKTARIVSQTIQEIFPQIIDDEPTLDYAPVKHGRWKWDGCIVRCTVCNERPPDDWQTDFCPNCGARMAGDGE